MTTCPTSQRLRRRGIARGRGFALAIAAFALLLLTATGARAQQEGTGVRIGVSADPDQFYFGFHLDTGPIVDRLSFRPNAEIGVGGDRVSVAGNFEFVYWWPLRRHPWEIYAGGGPAVNFYRFDERHGDDTDIQPGFNILLGVAHRRGLFFEMKLGFIDSPEFKAGFGYTWR